MIFLDGPKISIFTYRYSTGGRIFEINILKCFFFRIFAYMDIAGFQNPGVLKAALIFITFKMTLLYINQAFIKMGYFNCYLNWLHS